MRWCVGIVLRFEADGGVRMDVISGWVEQYGGQVGFYRQAAACGGLGQPGGLHHGGRLFRFQYVTVVVTFVPFQLFMVGV